MLRLAICDDMDDFLFSTKTLLEHWKSKPDEIIVELFTNGDALIDAHTTKPFDIILLDIIMPCLNGIETAAEIRKFDDSVKIVFLTSSTDYAVESYTVYASNYLLKPIEPDKLFLCLSKLASDILSTAKCITVKNGITLHRIPIRNIEYMEAQGKKVQFILSNGNKIESSTPFYLHENTLMAEDGFFKCHRSYMVNLHKITTYTQKEIQMKSGRYIPISRNCHKEFEAAYFELLFGKAGGA